MMPPETRSVRLSAQGPPAKPRLPVFGEVDPIIADLLRASPARAICRSAGRQIDLMQVIFLGVCCEVAHRHVIDHPLAQGRPCGRSERAAKRCFWLLMGSNSIEKRRGAKAWP